jgi:hypothetical protein
MQLTANEVIETIKTLPIDERAKIRDWINEEEKVQLSTESQERLERYRKAKKWLAENSEQYMNQWVCLYGDKLIASGTDGLEVHRKAKEAGIESPFLHHIVKEELWGGW